MVNQPNAGLQDRTSAADAPLSGLDAACKGVSAFTAAADRVFQSLARALTPDTARAVIDLEIDAILQARMEELADRSTEGVLTAAEKVEYEVYVETLDMLGALQAHARRIAAPGSN